MKSKRLLNSSPRREYKKLKMAHFGASLLVDDSKFHPAHNDTNGTKATVLVVDEFTVPGEKRNELQTCKINIEKWFKVSFAVLKHLDTFPVTRHDGNAMRIWVQLNGTNSDVGKAKEYIKGLCEPELEEKECYPRDMHCIFVGANSLFLNCLIQDTCADVQVLELGVLCIKGGTEAVVMARSHIQQFVKLFKNNQSLPSKMETSIKKRFKIFVEEHADKYTMDLLLLPSSLKEELLDLIKNFEHCETKEEVVDLTKPYTSKAVLDRAMSRTQPPEIASEKTSHLEKTRKKAGTPVTELAEQIDSVLSEASQEEFHPENGKALCQESSDNQERLPCKRRCSGSENRNTKRPFSLEEAECSASEGANKTELEDSVLELSDIGDSDSSVIFVEDWIDVTPEREYKILVDFFKTMGYSQDIVEQVIKRVGQLEEPLLLLEHIEKESNKCQRGKNTSPPHISGGLDSYLQEDQRKNMLQRRTLKISSGNSEYNKPKQDNKLWVKEEMQNNICNTSQHSENRLGGGLCKTNPVTITSSVATFTPKGSKTVTNQQNKSVIEIDSIETDGPAIPSCTIQGLVPDRVELAESEFIARGSSACLHPKPVQKELVTLQQKSTGPSNEQSARQADRELLGFSRPPIEQAVGRPMLFHQEPTVAPSPYLIGQCQDNDPMVTGIQRFFNSLKTPYNLRLKNEPGKAYLKHIIIDGSNVAMAHGLSKIFSCRGIAIAVEHFWNRGHRNITVFVPQWRTKRDPNITEQHFLTQLKELGVLSFTPARTVCGTRIAAHDDRFLLHLSERTRGIIVTNDNLKEFVNESPTWRDIIKTRLLQFTFVGDIFMVPDDPLGRNGPKLEQFLCNEDYIRDCPPAYNAVMCGENRLTRNPISTPNAIPLSTLAAIPLLMNRQPSAWISQARPEMNRVPPYRAANPPPLQNQLLNPVVPPQRSATETERLKHELLRIFPEIQQKQKIDKILAAHPYMRDMNALSAMVLD